MAIPKRLLQRAVDRNAVRRAARQAWTVQAKRHGNRDCGALLRLTAVPGQFGQISRPARKRLWRVELEELMDRYFAKSNA